jgi:coenzyme F420-reducing hydrogenase delta subunit
MASSWRHATINFNVADATSEGEKMDQLINLVDAITIIKTARIAVSGASAVVWNKVNNAAEYLDKQVAELLAE